MKNRKCKLTALLLALLLLLSVLAGCAKSSEAVLDNAEPMPAPEAEPMPAPEMEPAYPEEAPTVDESLTTSVNAQNTATEDQKQKTLAEKIIYSGYLYIETTAFDDAISSLEAMVSEFGGFIENTNVDGSTSYINGQSKLTDRSASYTVRIPCQRFTEFRQRSGSLGNVLRSNTTADNITAQFTDVEARKESLLTQEERLLAMMEKADTTESLIALESRLSEVRYEIESLERQLIDWQNSVDYSTFQLDLREVEVYTPVVPIQRTFGEKLKDSFRSGFTGFVAFLQSFAIWFVGALPTLALLALIIFLIVLLLKVYRRRAKARQAKSRSVYAKPVDPPEDQQKQ